MKKIVITLTAVLLACGVAYSQDEPGANYEHLKSYDQLIGNWIYDGPLLEDSPVFGDKDSKMIVRISRRWILNKNAIEMNWSIEVKGDTVMSGKGMTGWDSAEGKIIGGGMNSRGGHGLDTATYDEATKTWTIAAKGVDAKGQATSSTILNRIVDADTFEWQNKDRQGGEVTGDSPIYTFKRDKQAARSRAGRRPQIRKLAPPRRRPQAANSSSSKQAPPIK